MTITLLTILVLAFLAGIILLSAKSPLHKMTRREFLEKLVHFVDGELTPFDVGEDGGQSYKIEFEYKKHHFVYEDLEKQGFRGKVYRAYVKLKAPSNLTLNFFEQKKSGAVRSDIFIASEVVSRYMDEDSILRTPEKFDDMKIQTNDIALTNELLDDGKILALFRKYKNVDNRGFPFVSLGIFDGLIIIEFRSGRSGKPNISDLRANVSSIDDYLNEMIMIARRISEATD